MAQLRLTLFCEGVATNCVTGLPGSIIFMENSVLFAAAQK